MKSYAVLWRVGEESDVAGSVEFGREGVVLAARAHSVAVPYSDLAAITVGANRTLSVERGHGEPLRITSLEGPGSLHELADELAQRRAARALAR